MSRRLPALAALLALLAGAGAGALAAPKGKIARLGRPARLKDPRSSRAYPGARIGYGRLYRAPVQWLRRHPYRRTSRSYVTRGFDPAARGNPFGGTAVTHTYNPSSLYRGGRVAPAPPRPAPRAPAVQAPAPASAGVAASRLALRKAPAPAARRPRPRPAGMRSPGRPPGSFVSVGAAD